MILESLFIIV